MQKSFKIYIIQMHISAVSARLVKTFTGYELNVSHKQYNKIEKKLF